MPVPMFDRFGIFPSRFGSLFLSNLKMIGLNPAATKAEVIPGGSIYRKYVATAFAEPLIRVQTPDLADLFASSPNVSLTSGYVCDTGAGSPTLSTILQLQRRAPGGIFQAANGGSHHIVTSNKGFLYIDEISVDQNSQEGAVASLTYYALSPDGDTIPVQQSLGNITGTPATNGLWFLGPTFISNSWGNRLSSVQRVTIRTGIQFACKSADGNAFCMDGSIVTLLPEIRIKFLDLTQLYENYANLFGNNQAVGTQLNIYLQKGAAGGIRTARNVASHVRIYADTACVDPDDISVQGQNDAEAELVFRVTNAALSLSINSTIPVDPGSLTMRTHTLSFGVVTNGETLACPQVSVSADLAVDADIAVPNPSTNLEADLSINHTNLKSLILLADQDLTVKTNNSGSPSQTINLQGGEAYIWNTQMGPANPITSDISKLYITNSSGADAMLQVRSLVDGTP